MKEQLEQLNRTVVALVLVLVLGGGGFVWWQFMYKPAVAARDSAQATASAAEATLADARGRLATAQQQVDEAKKANGGKVDESIARLQLAQEAITPKAAIDDAAVVLSRYADRSGISTVLEMKVPEGTESASSGATATPVTIKMKAAGSYLEMQHFISLVEESVEVKRGAMHVRGRLFNVVSIEMRPPEQGTTSTDGSGSSSGGDSGSTSASSLKIGKGDIVYDLQIRMYVSAFGNDSGSTTAPGATADPATAGTASATATAPGATQPTTGATGAPSGADPATGAPTTGATGTPGATAATGTPGATTGTGTATPTAGATG